MALMLRYFTKFCKFWGTMHQSGWRMKIYLNFLRQKCSPMRLVFSDISLIIILPKTQNTLKYHLVTAEPPFTVKTIDWVHQTGPRKHSILLSVTHMLYVNQVRYGVGRCLKDWSCSSSSLEWKSMDSINGISYYLNKCYLDTIRRITDDNFSFRKTALCMQHRPTAAALSTNAAFGWKCDFRVFPFCQVMQKHIIWGGIAKHLLIAYFIDNIFTKNYQNPFMCVKVIASLRWDVFWDTV